MFFRFNILGLLVALEQNQHIKHNMNRSTKEANNKIIETKCDEKMSYIYTNKTENLPSFGIYFQ